MAKDYLELLLSLLPKGKAWNREQDSVLYKLFYGLSEELGRIDGRVNDLFLERDTRTTTELIAQHEEDLGLPDDCTANESLTLEQRRIVARARYIDLGKLSTEWFIEFAELLGYTITIQQYTPAWIDVFAAGDACGDLWILHRWHAIVDDSSPNIDILQCSFNKFRPAHTLVFFDFSGGAFSRDFSQDFDAIKTGLAGSFSQDFSQDFDVFGTGNDSILTGSFSKAFSFDFDRRNGGEFSPAFSFDFDRWQS